MSKFKCMVGKQAEVVLVALFSSAIPLNIFPTDLLLRLIVNHIISAASDNAKLLLDRHIFISFNIIPV